MNDLIKQTLKNNRPQMSDSTMKTYVSLINSLVSKFNDVNNINFFINKKDDILNAIHDMQSNQSKKTLLSALYVLTNDKDYNDVMREYCKIVNDSYAQKHVKQERKNAMITMDDIKNIYNEHLKLSKKYPESFSHWNDYIIVCLYSGLFIPVRRLQDYAFMKIKNYDANADNYLFVKNRKMYFYFNKFKTSKYVKNDDDRIIEIPNDLAKILKKWMKINESDYLIIQTNQKPYTVQNLNNTLNKLFGNYIGVDMLRSINVSENLGNKINEKMKLENEINDIAKKMGSSSNMLENVYNKKI